MLEKIGGRKVAVGMLFLGIAVALAVKLGDIPTNLMQFMIYLSAGFFLGNGVEHIAGALTSKTQEAAQQSTDALTPIQDQLKALQAQSDEASKGIVLVQQALQFIMEKAGLTK